MGEIDNTKGQVKQMRGSGPPILTVEGNAVGIEAIVYVLPAVSYASYGAAKMPATAQVIGIDLTRRTVRLQVLGGREILYCATHDQDGRDGSYWMFSTDGVARRHSIRQCEETVKRAEKEADTAIERLERCKADLQDAEQWAPKDWE